MTGIICVLLSAAGFFFSLNHGEIWPLGWIAPVPVLWFAFGETHRFAAFAAAFVAFALGATNILAAYAGTMPVFVLVLATCGPALYFALCTSAARFAAIRLGPLFGAILFATLWTACDYLVGLGRNGTAPSPAYAEVGAPMLIQSASVFGLWIVTFLLGLVPAGLAASLRTRNVIPAIVALVVFAANAGFGAWRLAHAESNGTVRIGLAGDDSISLRATAEHPAAALDAANRYAAAARTLAHQGATLIVFPEKVIKLVPGASPESIPIMQAAARDTHATIVMGFDSRKGMPRNAALVFPPSGAAPALYFKRHMVEGLEDVFVPGDGPFAMRDKTDVEICKDMDYPQMLRGDSRALHPTLLAVPAWDFDLDRWWHARLAIMRGVEDGFALARAAKDGLLTLTDAEGRVVAMKRTEESGMVTLVGDLPRGSGNTLYLRIGDVFAWICIAVSVLLLGLSFATRKSTAS
jgi:apolipoprotein N-acyltransferase